jgi:tRNA-specific 2-thiouridylase
MGKQHMTNTLNVTQNAADLQANWLRANEVNWLTPAQLPMQCSAKIRYRQADQDCHVSQAADGALLVRFNQPQRAITPGQHIAFYLGEQMLGGATIRIAGPSFLNHRAL